ncbi:MAG: hypothetical protein II990_01935 [Muribaculaceae bacterium]|nr:hypothetical protein [Muribaculaceae bacterium]
MKDAHLKYLQRCLKSRLLGNRTEFHNRSRAKIYKVLDRILNDERFYGVLDFRRQWISYASKRITKFVDSLTDGDKNDEIVLNEKIEIFVVEWFLSHFGKELIFEDEENVEKTKKQYSEIYDDEYDEVEESEGDPFIDKFAKDSTSVDDATRINVANLQLPAELSAFAHGKGKGEEDKTEIEYLKSIDKSIVDLALMLGRSGESILTTSSKPQFSRSSHSDISGVTIGDDLNAMLPTETALLGNHVTESVFYRRYVEKRLQVFASASTMSKGKEKKGPIILCVDTSSSMDGEPADMAKRLALAVAIVAQRTHRTLCVINYSDTLSYFILTNLQRQLKSFLRFIAHSYHGGNDENLLFRFIFCSLLKGRRYEHLRNKLSGADLLVISDYFWGGLSAKVEDSLDEAKRNGMRLFSLNVGGRSSSICEDFYMDWLGTQYLKRCYQRYIYEDGKCLEENETNE